MKQIITLAVLCLLSISLKAQDETESLGHNKLSYRLTLGINVGGVSPIPLPNTVREIKNYNVSFNPAIGIEGLYAFNSKWSIGANPRIEYKGMKVKNRVMYMHTIIEVKDGDDVSSFEGAFSGINYTETRNAYLSFPLFVQFTPRKQWHYKLGGYLAFLLKSKFSGYVADGYIRNGGSLGEKVEVSLANFNFSDNIRKFDCGFNAGVTRNIGQHWSVDLNLQWGLLSVFPSSFTGVTFPMYNVFGQFGVGYRL